MGGDRWLGSVAWGVEGGGRSAPFYVPKKTGAHIERARRPAKTLLYIIYRFTCKENLLSSTYCSASLLLLVVRKLYRWMCPIWYREGWNQSYTWTRIPVVHCLRLLATLILALGPFRSTWRNKSIGYQGLCRRQLFNFHHPFIEICIPHFCLVTKSLALSWNQRPRPCLIN